ncbi:MAG: hypothetical protein F4232_06250, partial [Acidimicrobiaceae bacterium]|nr:hypothetical protein [Acidimicrobiaceae bacterium]
MSAADVGNATLAFPVVQTRSPARSPRSNSAQPQPGSSTGAAVTTDEMVTVSPGKTGSCIRTETRPSRPRGPVQPVTARSIQASWLGVFRNMSERGLIGGQSRRRVVIP